MKTPTISTTRQFENSAFPNLFRISIFGFRILHSSSFHISDRRKSCDRLTNSRRLCRRDYLINILVSATCLLGEARPRCAADVNAARFEIALELFALPLFPGLGAAHRATATVCRAKESSGA